MGRVLSSGQGEIGIKNAIQALEQYKTDLLNKAKVFTERLALIGVQEASIRFTTAMYDGINDSSVSLEHDGGNAYRIVADGKAVAFIEFGSGVYHNTGEPYPNPRPEGVSAIGEFGAGKGKRKAWYYKGDPGTNGELQEGGVVKTRGNPAAMPMWYATEEMKQSIITLAKEVFG